MWPPSPRTCWSSTDADGEAIIGRLDQALERRNIEYEAKRPSGRYGSPVLRLFPVGELDRYRHRMVDAGRADGQFKILRLTADATFGDHFTVTREIGAADGANALIITR